MEHLESTFSIHDKITALSKWTDIREQTGTSFSMYPKMGEYEKDGAIL